MSRLNRNLPSWFSMAPVVVFSLGRRRLSSESIIGPRDRIRTALVERTARDISRGAGRWVKQDNSLLCYSQLHTRYAQHSCWAYRYSKPGAPKWPGAATRLRLFSSLGGNLQLGPIDRHLDNELISALLMRNRSLDG